jgi:hypothetical protein
VAILLFLLLLLCCQQARDGPSLEYLEQVCLPCLLLQVIRAGRVSEAGLQG